MATAAGKGLAALPADFFRKWIVLLLPRLQQQEQTGYILMDEGCLDLELSTQGPAATLSESLLGRARHSVRAAPGDKVTRVAIPAGRGLPALPRAFLRKRIALLLPRLQ